MASCLDALACQTIAAEIVVVDNGPGEGCADMLASRYPDVIRIDFGGKNLGFGAAINRAVAAYGKGPVILLNDDTVPEPDFVQNLVEVWDSGAIGMVAAVLLKVEKPDLIDSAGIVCDRNLNAWDYLSGEPVATLRRAEDPLGPTGGGALFDRVAFTQVGGFDKRIFLYYEDLDLALRMRVIGITCRLAPNARAHHAGSATLGRHTAAKYRQTGFSRAFLLRKYGILRRPVPAFQVVLGDFTACLAQLALDHTVAGALGRMDGWKSAQRINLLEVPTGYLERPSLRRQLGVRLRRRRSS